jgi:hypothetical protein
LSTKEVVLAVVGSVVVEEITSPCALVTVVVTAPSAATVTVVVSPDAEGVDALEGAAGVAEAWAATALDALLSAEILM